MINIRHYFCAEMYGSVTVTTEGKPKLDEGQTGHRDCPGSQNPSQNILSHAVLPVEESHLSQNASHWHQCYCASQLRFTQHTCLLQQHAANGGGHLCWGIGFWHLLLFLLGGCESFQNETHCHN